MCGICGEIHFDNTELEKSEIENLMKAIKHRGPDGEGYYLDKNVGLGHVRLSIIDVSENANQPMYSPNGEYIIVFNGEIYNYQEIRRELPSKYKFRSTSDTEVLLYSYMEWGEKCLLKLDGMFSFVIYDKKNQQIFGARDRFGVKPFFYFYDKKKFVFGSEIKAILASQGIQAELNEKMLFDFLAFNRTDHSTETCFSGINNLRPSHYIKINTQTGKKFVNRWYSLPEMKENKNSLGKNRKILYKKLSRSVKLHMISDVPVGVSLSGGLDSSTIASLMRKEVGNKISIPSFSAVYGDSWEKDEKKYIEEMCDYLSIEPEYTKPTSSALLNDFDKLIYCQEEPFISASLFAGWCVARKTNEKKVKVLMTGQGADEIFGYDYMAAFYFYELFRKFKLILLFKEVYQFLRKQKFSGVFTMRLFIFLIVPEFLKEPFVSASSPIIAKGFYKKNKGKSNFFKEFFKAKTLNDSVRNHLLYKLNHNLRVDDKNAMAFSVEGRVPFLENELVEFCLSLPSNMKVRNGEIKFLLKDATTGILPEKISKRNDKIGYDTPMDIWFRDSKFVEYIDNLLSSSYQPMEQYLNLNYIKNKWVKHKENKENNGQIIWKYIFLTRWYKIFFDNKK